MRVAIITNGRFHVCDLARELAALGHDVAFYSMVPPGRTARFGLPRACNRWLGPYLAPLYGALVATRGTRFAEEANRALVTGLDAVVSRVLEPCDVLIGLASMCLRSIETARRRYGARILVERGSRHILSQREILEALPGIRRETRLVPDWAVHRELAEYALADTIVVPSHHTLESFRSRGFDEDKLFRNPYGVSLDMFPPTEAPPASRPTVVMAGTWSLRKGCDLLAEAVRGLDGVRLLHVGSVGDCPLPTDGFFEHRPAVPQPELTRIYAEGHVFALASHEEGLSLVQAQALASGLDLVCTDRTGGEDLAEMLGVEERVTVVPHGHVPRLREALAKALRRTTKLRGLRALADDARERLSWKAYGQRYHRFLTAEAVGAPAAMERR